MTASRSGLGPASGGDALESVTGKNRSNNDVKQPLTRLVVNFYRTVVAQAKKDGSRRHGAKALDVRGKATRCARSPHPALRATFSRKREKGWYFRLLAVLRLEIEDQVALQHRLDARVRQPLALEHPHRDRPAAACVLGTRRIYLGAHHVPAGPRGWARTSAQ